MRRSFYERRVVHVARELVGATVVHGDTAGVIVETEAYHDSEPACHAHAGRTPRTETLFGGAGRAYVYRSYGVHAMLNAVCEAEGVGAAVLIRALEPIAGVDHMRARRGVKDLGDLCSGPGKLTQALGIGFDLNGSDLVRGAIQIHEAVGSWRYPAPAVLAVAPRVGITKATDLPWRFCAAGSRFVSPPRPKAPGARVA